MPALAQPSAGTSVVSHPVVGAQMLDPPPVPDPPVPVAPPVPASVHAWVGSASSGQKAPDSELTHHPVQWSQQRMPDVQVNDPHCSPVQITDGQAPSEQYRAPSHPEQQVALLAHVVPPHCGPDPPVPVGWHARPEQTAPGGLQVPVPLQSMQQT
ncbi:MAG TPA: hypothetical protein VGJ84_12570 [Polyangiaceae bacterium]